MELNVPSYYAFAAIYFFREDGIGRRKLSKKLGLSESKTRTMIKHLQQDHYIKSEKITKLSQKGLKSYNENQANIKKIKEIDSSSLTVSKENMGALVSKKDAEIEKGLKIRDQAVRAGAKGLTILKYNNQFHFPGESVPESGKILDKLKDIEEDFTEAEKGDILLISSSNNLDEAKSGLWSSLEELLVE